MSNDNQGPGFLGTSNMLEGLSPHQRQELQARLEEGFLLRNVSPKWFSLLSERAGWDAAIILDACRYDTFAKVNMLPGRLERRVSGGSCTEDWIAANIDAPLDDVVYISASPYVSRWYLEQIGLDMPFAHIEEVWQAGWDDALHTVPPGAIAAAYQRLRVEFPGKKFVLHFMQPHHPFIGRLRVEGAGWRQFFGAMELDVPQLEGQTPIEMLAEGKVDRQTVVSAYESNLQLVLDEIASLRPALPPRTVITADHGEAFGECGVFGHPPGLLLPELIEVPYLELQVVGHRQ